MGSLNSHQLLVRIDLADDESQCQKELETIFKKYDENENGELEGDELEKFLKDVSDYVIEENAVKLKDKGIALDPAHLTAIRDWVKTMLDPDNSGTCNLEKIKSKLKPIVDECDYSER